MSTERSKERDQGSFQYTVKGGVWDIRRMISGPPDGFVVSRPQEYYNKYELPEYYYLMRYSTPPTKNTGRSHTIRKLREVEQSVACSAAGYGLMYVFLGQNISFPIDPPTPRIRMTTCGF